MWIQIWTSCIAFICVFSHHTLFEWLFGSVVAIFFFCFVVFQYMTKRSLITFDSWNTLSTEASIVCRRKYTLAHSLELFVHIIESSLDYDQARIPHCAWNRIIFFLFFKSLQQYNDTNTKKIVNKRKRDEKQI